MLVVQFLDYDGKPIRTVGPLPWVRLEATSLYVGPDDEEVARHQNGIWSAADFEAPRYVIHGSTCTFRFEDEQAEDSARFGLVDQVDVVDGAIYIPPGHRLVAHLEEEKQAWYVYQEKRFWPALVLEHCAGPEGSDGG